MARPRPPLDGPADLRWTRAEAPSAQGELFGDEGWVAGSGEYRGLDFLHVRARRIINEVKGAAANLPFRFTINAYRGCSHACSYCASPDTPVLLAAGRVVRIADLRVGDLVVGTERVGQYRRYVATPVLDHWSTIRPAWRVRLEDGTELIASGDHRFLSERGWKHVTGTDQGHERRPHLTLGNSLLGIGPFPEPPKVDDDYRRGYLCGMVRGDGSGDPEAQKRVDELHADLGVRPHDRASVECVIAWPETPSLEWTKGFLAGIFDAEGHLGEVVRISNGDPAILGWVMRSLERLGFRAVLEPARPNGVRNVRFLGGLPETVRFILAVDPATPRKRSILGRAMKGSGRRRVVAIEPLGIDIPMYDITTGTGDFIADGVVSHNCFARPTHEYLGLDTGRDFDQRIVVKVNAAERLRAELSPARWAGHHIAMGTNTDPYQRAEGRYRLTRSIIEVLGEAANPFSILTKSSLVLRDLDVLVAARARTDVRVNLSIGTLDTDVWRLTEPGTPHPERRLEAVAALNEAGIPCGVLVAPILPGLSDGREQLEAVAEACVEAGAVSVSAILLHLRPGVKEHYLESLRATRPDLAERTERMYPRANGPKDDQRRVSSIVHAAVRRAGGCSAEPRASEHLTGQEAAVAVPEPARRPSSPPRQLGLDL